MRCNTDRLRAYLDKALPHEEQDEIAAHLETCAACRAELTRLQGEARLVARALAHLDVVPAAPDAARACIASVTSTGSRNRRCGTGCKGVWV